MVDFKNFKQNVKSEKILPNPFSHWELSKGRNVYCFLVWYIICYVTYLIELTLTWFLKAVLGPQLLHEQICTIQRREVICMYMCKNKHLHTYRHMSHFQILAIGNFSTNHAFVPWIGEKQHIALEWSSKSFPGTTSMSWWLENCHKKNILKSRGQSHY